MSSLDLVHDFIRATNVEHSLGGLHEILDAVTRELGFSHFALLQHVDVHRANGRNIWLHTYPEGWMTRSVKSDPILAASYQTHLGFRWKDVGRLITITAQHRQVFETAKIFGIGDGYTVPTHIPGQIEGSCSFATSADRLTSEISLPAAQLIGAYAFEAARTIVKKTAKQIPPARIGLTSRQIDCVVQVARGKSDWEIGKILGIQEDTVSEHLSSARKRYDVERRVQLVLRALQDGHITLADTLH